MRSVTNTDVAARDALAAHGLTMPALSSIPKHPHVLTDAKTTVVKLRHSIDEALDEIYWLRILGDGGVLVAPLLVEEPVSIDDAFGVITRFLAPDRETDERDTAEAGKVMRLVHDIALEYVESDGTSWVPQGMQPRDLVLYNGALHLVGLRRVERRERAGARLGAADDFSGELRADVIEQARRQFLAAYDA
ncbi:hypothetical protein ABE10_11400 [Bacillus toyonensis]|nr:hypothetical protein [Bacillus toyonensis]